MNNITTLKQHEISAVTGSTDSNTRDVLWQTLKDGITIIGGAITLSILIHFSDKNNRTRDKQSFMPAILAAFGITTILHVTEYIFGTFINIAEEQFLN